VVSKDDLLSFGFVFDNDVFEDFKKIVLFDAVKLKPEIIIEEPIVVSDEVITKEVNNDFVTESDAKNYDEFLSKTFNNWEEKILDNIDRTIKDEIQKEVLQKTFGEFLQRLFNTVNTSKFFDSIKRVIKIEYNSGVENAEKELNMDIGIKADMNNYFNLMTSRQIDGFTIPGGDRWNGLKGVSTELTHGVMKIVNTGVDERKSLKDIKNEIKELMITYKGGTHVSGEVTDGRAMKIARTETNRFHNVAKNNAYKESGLSGKKMWDAFLDNRTSDVCKRLNGQIVGFDENFKDPLTGEEYPHPPSHPNCRSVIQFIPD